MSTVENRGIANAAAFRRVGADATPSPGLHFHIHDAVGELPPPIEAGGQESLEVVGRELVVVVEPRDPPPAREPEGFIGRRGPGNQPPEIGILRVLASCREVVKADAGIASVAKQRFRVIRTGVPDDDDLETRVGLPEHGGHAPLPEQLGAVVGGHEDRYQGLGVPVQVLRPDPCHPQPSEMLESITVELTW